MYSSARNTEGIPLAWPEAVHLGHGTPQPSFHLYFALVLPIEVTNCTACSFLRQHRTLPRPPVGYTVRCRTPPVDFHPRTPKHRRYRGFKYHEYHGSQAPCGTVQFSKRVPSTPAVKYKALTGELAIVSSASSATPARSRKPSALLYDVQKWKCTKRRLQFEVLPAAEGWRSDARHLSISSGLGCAPLALSRTTTAQLFYFMLDSLHPRGPVYST